MTSNRLISFLFEGEVFVRVIYRDGVPWFAKADVCRALGIGDASEVLDGLDEDEIDVSVATNANGERVLSLISEGGLFTAILRCEDAMKKGTLPHRFRRWVTGAVLPAIRAAHERPVDGGVYVLPEATRVRLVSEARQTFGVRASAELWFRLNLPTVPAMKAAANQSDLFMRRRTDDGAIVAAG